eukprot:scaffold186505_cov34-Prasinocladus_malaysianus.AAC.1
MLSQAPTYLWAAANNRYSSSKRPLTVTCDPPADLSHHAAHGFQNVMIRSNMFHMIVPTKVTIGAQVVHVESSKLYTQCLRTKCCSFERCKGITEAMKDGPAQSVGKDPIDELIHMQYALSIYFYFIELRWRPGIGVKQVQEPEPTSQPGATSVAAAPTTAAAGKAKKKGAVIGSAPKLNPEGLLAKYQAEKQYDILMRAGRNCEQAAKAALLAKAAKTTAARPQGSAAASVASAVSNTVACTHHDCANIWRSQAGNALARASGRVIMAAEPHRCSEPFHKLYSRSSQLESVNMHATHFTARTSPRHCPSYAFYQLQPCPRLPRPRPPRSGPSRELSTKANAAGPLASSTRQGKWRGGPRPAGPPPS